MSYQSTISVAIPTLNESENIERAIKSVISQSETNIEIIVCDAGSTDGTKEIVESLCRENIRLVVDKNGLMSQMNTICKEAIGDYLAILDADSVMLPGRLKKQKEVLEASPSIAAVGTALRYCDQNNLHLYTLDAPIGDGIKWQAIRTNPINHTTAMLRKKAVESVGGYVQRPFGDYDLMIRLAEDWELTNIGEVLTETLERPSRGGRDFSPLISIYHNTLIGLKAIILMKWNKSEYPIAFAIRMGTTLKLLRRIF